IPEYMGCLREYADAKSFAGGRRRAREIRDMLQRHTGRRISPGYIVYGLDTYQKIWCDRIEEMCGRFRPLARTLQMGVRFAAGTVIGHTIRDSQGLYSDGWAARVLRYMLPCGAGTFLIEGALPPRSALAGQSLRIEANGRSLGVVEVPEGEFQIPVEIPAEMQEQALNLTIT